MAQPNEPFQISVKLEAATDQLKPGLSESCQVKVNGLYQMRVEVKEGGAAVELDSIPEFDESPQLLILRPELPDKKKGDYTTDPINPAIPEKLKAAIEYGTAKGGADKRKPLNGTHLFVNGMAEWITDSAAAPLKLFFWNNLTPVGPGSPDLTIYVQILIAHTPKTV